MPRYMIELSYSPEDCIESLGKIEQRELDFLPQVYWGYAQDIETGWAIVEAPNEEAAWKMVPEDLRDSVEVTEVKNLTPELIIAMRDNAIESAA